jgi:hypothetical protein
MLRCLDRGQRSDDFGFSGRDLVEFVKLNIRALLERGAKPAIGGGGTAYDWILQPQYGNTDDQIVQSVIAERSDRAAGLRSGRPVVRAAREMRALQARSVRLKR